MIEIGGRPIGEFSLEHIQFFTAQALRHFFLRLRARPVSVGTMALLAIHSGALFIFRVFEWTGKLQPLQAIERDEGGRRWGIEPPAAMVQYPGLPVVISSFRAQAEIARPLAAQCANPQVCLYPEEQA